MKTALTLLLFGSLISCGDLGTGFNDADGCSGYDEPSSSKYILPYSVGFKYEVTQGNCGGFSHQGVSKFAYDFSIPFGTSILASRSGVVSSIENSMGNSSADENHVFVTHSDGSEARYVHIKKDSIPFAVGETVLQGQKIAEASESFFHFDVRGSGSSIPVTFRNATEGRYGLRGGVSYLAEEYTNE